MPSKHRKLIGILFFILIVSTGFAVGHHYQSLYENKSQRDQNPVTVPVTTGAIKSYKTSPVSTGAYLIKTPITIPKGTVFPVVSIEDTVEKIYSKGQKILFYNSKSELLDMTGEIIDLIESRNSKTSLLIEIKSLDLASLKHFEKAYVVTGRKMNVPRLPLKAVLQDKNKNDFVWMAKFSDEGRVKAYRRSLDIVALEKDYVVLTAEEAYYDDVILNPDDFLDEGQEIKIERDYYLGPGITDDNLLEIKITQAEQKRRAENIQNKKETTDLVPSQGCPASGTFVTDIQRSVGPPALPFTPPAKTKQ